MALLAALAPGARTPPPAVILSTGWGPIEAHAAGHRDGPLAAERALIERIVARHQASLGGPDATVPEPYPFNPQAGNLSEDLTVSNFTDLDPGPDVRSYECTAWSYDGHTGIDMVIRSFGEQDVGVPVYAALPGTVVATLDGQPDRNTSFGGQPANFVILHHGGTHYSLSWHLKQGSVAVSPGQVVPAGRQIGSTGSSGNSTWPHLHFESRVDGAWYEPYAGPCRPGPSNWGDQPEPRSDLFVSDLNLSDQAIGRDPTPTPPYDVARTGTFVGAGLTPVRVSMWAILHNLPPAPTFQLTFLGPEGAARWAGASAFVTARAYRFAWIYLNLSVRLDTPGTWRLDLAMDGVVLARAPFEVVSSPAQRVNRPPAMVAAVLDPPRPSADVVPFCRVNPPLVADDPDYDIVRFRYRWTVNGAVVRDVTIAAGSDALERGLLGAGDRLGCEVMPSDGTVSGPPTTARVVVGSADVDPPRVSLTRPAAGTVYLPGSQQGGLPLDEAVVPAGEGFALEALVTDASPTIVRFWVDGRVLCEGEGGVTCLWRPARGAHEVAVTATDDAGQTARASRSVLAA